MSRISARRMATQHNGGIVKVGAVVLAAIGMGVRVEVAVDVRVKVGSAVCVAVVVDV
jgi:hypothetical protein